MIKTLLIANRGEIAVRIIRAAKELGIFSVIAFSEADEESKAVEFADDAVCIGQAMSKKSYLNVEGIIDAANKVNADAIHPGYGFLAENSFFASAVESAGIIFVGPRSETIALMGDKINARKAAIDAGVPIIPGSSGEIVDITIAKKLAVELGFPVMIKATAGGGGKGIRQVFSSKELEENIDEAKREALAGFGNSGIFLEKSINKARHIEVQVLSDGKHFLHFFERDCSLQRNKQKIWEESPAIGISEKTKTKIFDAAISLTKKISYIGAGTVEFIYDSESENFFFLEMNTRIQVEHPVTEMVVGIDLVRLGLEIAGGESLNLKQEEIKSRGHAIEIRINAEDPANQFFPSPGKILDFRAPDGPGTRFDSMLYLGYEIPPFYDSLIGKLIVWDENRDKAIKRLKRTIGELNICGIKTNIDMLRLLTEDKQIKAGPVNTNWLENWLKTNLNYLN